jgi:ferric-dicitrate binding protein FerR (iron transport regulator)
VNDDPPQSDGQDDDPIERSLERGLHRDVLSPATLTRIRAAVHEEFLATARAVRRRRLAKTAAIAACLAGLAIAVAMFILPMREGALVGSVAGVHRVSTPSGLPPETQSLQVGAELHVGEHWEARDFTLLALVSGGMIRIQPGTIIDATVDATGGNEIALRAGRLYLDFPPGSKPFVLHTPGGIVEHVGTQFEVFATAREVRIRVREGSVRVHTLQGTETIETGAELFVPDAGPVVSHSVPTYGPEWEWVEAISPAFEIENRPLSEFLAWVARETGRRVDFTDAHAQEVALHTRLHGSVDGLKPLEALDRVLSTTSLRFEVDGGTIRVSSRP